MILDEIVVAKKRDLAGIQARVPLTELKKRIEGQREALDLARALQTEDVSIIAEVKKASPSSGLLVPDFDHVRLARAYASGGTAAISVLTEVNYFQGDLNFLPDIKQALGEREIPLLRKDFLFDPYQVYESRAYGADAILLIAAILDTAQMKSMISLAHGLGMACLVEVHDRYELERVLVSDARIIGINNRDLRTFEVNMVTTGQLRSLIPHDCLVVSESGISRREDIIRLGEWNVNAALIGEALVTADNTAGKLAELRGAGPGVEEAG